MAVRDENVACRLARVKAYPTGCGLILTVTTMWFSGRRCAVCGNPIPSDRPSTGWGGRLAPRPAKTRFSCLAARDLEMFRRTSLTTLPDLLRRLAVLSAVRIAPHGARPGGVFQV